MTSARVLIVIDMQEKAPFRRMTTEKKGSFRYIVMDRIAALGPDDEVVYVAMERGSHLARPISVRQAQDPGLLKQPLLTCFDGSSPANNVYVKSVWDGARNESLVQFLEGLYEGRGIRTFELVGAYGECCVASTLNGLRARFPYAAIEVNERCTKFLSEFYLGKRGGRQLGSRILHARTRKTPRVP